MQKKVAGFVLFVLLRGFFLNSIAQADSYNDVLLVINNSSSISDSVGSYFAHARSIPEKNIVHITASTAEEIDNVQFENIRHQIESYLISNNLQDSINYIVTTKGVPLKVMRQDVNANSSFENELALILGPYSTYIGKVGKLPSPYYKKRENFSRIKYGFYIVTRLDGYTFQDIKGIIDRSSVSFNSIPSEAQFIFDTDPLWTAVPILNKNMRNAADSLSARGLSTMLDTTTTFLTNKNNVLGYVSFGSNDNSDQIYTTNAIPGNSYLPGAITETYVSTSARSFNLPATYGQSLIADLIAEGVTAAKGYVYEPYSNAMADVSVLFPMYADGYTIGESFYSSSLFLSWMDVVIGDPKFRLITACSSSDTSMTASNDTTSALPVELVSFTSAVVGSMVELSWKTITETNNYGFDIERRSVPDGSWGKIAFVPGFGTSNSPREYAWKDMNVSTGTFAYRLKQMDHNGNFQYSMSVEIVLSDMPGELQILGNYPNPFNPSTKIKFSVPKAGRAQLKIFNILGQEIATIFQGFVQTAGIFEQEFNASGLSSGLYLSVLEYGNQRVIHKMILTK